MIVDDLAFHSVSVDGTVPGAEVALMFERDRTLPGVIVIRPGASPSLVARHRFYNRLGRLYGVEIYMPRPISFFLQSAPETPLILPAGTTVQQAVCRCLERGDSVYDPFLVLMPESGPRLLTFESLILKQTELLSIAQLEAESQKTMAIAGNNAKSQFLAVMSHELRTPLTAIIGYGEIVLEDIAAGCLDEVAPRVQNIVSAGLHLLEMINGILDLAKVEAGKSELALETFSIPVFLGELADALVPLMKKNANEFSLLADDGLGEMTSDKTKLKQCLLNLLGNASKFTHNGRVSLRATIETQDEKRWAVFEVTDTGIGISREQMQNLFQPFYQADSSISRRFGGTGLGLSLTKGYCELMGGTLTVHTVLGQGSTFTIRLLLEDTSAEPEPPRLDTLPDTPHGKPRKRLKHEVAA